MPLFNVYVIAYVIAGYGVHLDPRRRWLVAGWSCPVAPAGELGLALPTVVVSWPSRCEAGGLDWPARVL
ncbi:hypothetical protein [Mycobacterium sp.]|uniref:hypothetical protein n=1 Tax=Mycobacterium sp. TaxID=1785 RepID=UPI003BA8490C